MGHTQMQGSLNSDASNTHTSYAISTSRVLLTLRRRLPISAGSAPRGRHRPKERAQTDHSCALEAHHLCQVLVAASWAATSTPVVLPWEKVFGPINLCTAEAKCVHMVWQQVIRGFQPTDVGSETAKPRREISPSQMVSHEEPRQCLFSEFKILSWKDAFTYDPHVRDSHIAFVLEIVDFQVKKDKGSSSVHVVFEFDLRVKCFFGIITSERREPRTNDTTMAGDWWRSRHSFLIKVALTHNARFLEPQMVVSNIETHSSAYDDGKVISQMAMKVLKFAWKWM